PVGHPAPGGLHLDLHHRTTSTIERPPPSNDLHHRTLPHVSGPTVSFRPRDGAGTGRHGVMIEVTLLGTGSPVPDAHRAGPSTLVRAGHQTLLIDCGRGVQQRMAGAETSATALTALLLTHLHSDHIADLGDLLITRWISNFDPQLPPLPIIGPPGTAEVVSATLRAFGHDIGYRMKHHADLTTPPQVDVKEATEGVVWDVDGVRIRVAPTDHRPVTPTIGFRVEHDGASVVLAGDTVPCESLDELAAGAGAMVHTVIRKELIAQLPLQRIRE